MRNKFSLRYRHMISLLLILIPVMVFVMYFSYTTTMTSMQHVEQATYEQFQAAVDSVISLLRRFDDLINASQSWQNYFTDLDNGLAVHDTQFQAALENIEHQLSSDAEVVMYIRGDDRIYTRDGTMSYNSYEHQIKAEYDMYRSLFFSNLLSIRKPTLTCLIPKPDSVHQSNLLCYMIPVTINTPKKHDLIFCFQLDSSALETIFTRYLGEDFTEKNILIYDQVHSIVFYHSGSAILDAKEVMRLYGSGVITVKQGQHEFRLARVISNDYALVFTLLATKDAFFRSLKSTQITQNNLQLTLMVVMLISTIVIVYINYIPIRGLVSDVIGHRELRIVDNELELLKTHYDAMAQSIEGMVSRLQFMDSFITNQLVTRLVCNRISSRSELNYWLHCANLELHYPYYCVINIFPFSNSDEEREQLKLMSYTQQTERINLLCGEFLQEKNLCIIVNFDPCDQPPKSFILGLADTLYNTIRSQNLANVLIGIGNPYTDLMDMPSSFAEACVAAQLTSNSNQNPYAVWMRQESSASSQTTPSNTLLAKLLLEHLKHGDSKNAKSILEQMISHSANQALDSFLFFRYESAEIIRLLIEQAEHSSFYIEKQKLVHLLSYNSAKEFYSRASALIDQLCDQVNDIARQKDLHMRQTIMDYLHAHYMDPDLSITSVAETLNLRPSQINAILREDVGMTFSQYVPFLRMSAFKSLLLSTDLPIAQLIVQVGYIDVPNFLRKFKQLEGVTPSQFRTLHKSPK